MVGAAAQNRHNNFNLLRLTFAVLVILAHSFELVDGNNSREILTLIFHTVSFGTLAVDGFFLLSGYLIVQSWESLPQVGQFLKKRILRIYPAFVVASIICTFIVAPLGSSVPQYFSGFPVWQSLKNTVLFGLPVTRPVFVDQPFPMVNGSMWTILIEFKCYLAVLLIGLLGGIGRRQIWLFLTASILSVLGYQNAGGGCQTRFIGCSVKTPSVSWVSFLLVDVSICSENSYPLAGNLSS